MTDENTTRIALRRDNLGRLDDLYVRDVEMFRAEMLTDTSLWLGCYLGGTGVDGDRLALLVTVEDGRLRLHVDEQPTGSATYESTEG